MKRSLTYVVRREGRVHFEGDLPSLRAWLSDNRINSDDEVRKQGLEVLEGERLWSLVKDRPELGYDVAAERLRLSKAGRLARASLVAFTVLSIAVITLLVINQGVPRYDYATEVSSIRDGHAKIAEELSKQVRTLRSSNDELLGKLAEAGKSNEILAGKLSELERALVIKDEDMGKQAALAAATLRAREVTLLGQIETLKSNLQQQLQINAELSRTPSFERALAISWGTSPIAPSYVRDKYLILRNLTSDTLSVRISITSPISHDFSATIEPNASFNSSQHLNAPLLYVGYQLRITILGSKHGSVREVTVK